MIPYPDLASESRKEGPEDLSRSFVSMLASERRCVTIGRYPVVTLAQEGFVHRDLADLAIPIAATRETGDRFAPALAARGR
jgi:hypothetical protein